MRGLVAIVAVLALAGCSDSGDGADGIGCGLLRSQAITPIASASTSVYTRSGMGILLGRRKRKRAAACRNAFLRGESVLVQLLWLRDVSESYALR